MAYDHEKAFEEANKRVHKVEDQWHYPILVEAGYEALNKEDVGFVRQYHYKHPATGHEIMCCTGVSADYWMDRANKKQGLWAELTPHLITLVAKRAEQQAETEKKHG